MLSVLLAVASAVASPVARSALARPHVARAAVRMAADDKMPTTYADYKKGKDVEAINEKLKDGEVVYDANADWQRTEGEGGKSTMASSFESTDTPDFFDPNDPRSKIDFKEGITGSQKVRTEHNHDPGVAAALAVNPEVIAGVELDGNRRVDFVRPVARWPGDPAAELSAEFDFGPVSKIGNGLEFDIEPVCMTFEDFYAGFTADSDPAFSVSPAFGRMDRKGGEVTTLKVTCKPSGAARSIQATLCVVLPDDGEQWTFAFKATVNA
ncbi:hypothetical protein KFE25_002655 [Diacronema lutheri]|uniref:Uncharacterized protein n=1 Tax=Diacronema lutheri TaxID=2081491 RepID=A0A8J5XEB8_DIALT|nr:hypothetical protein KFE25_002655 [Diacronema lutheri]